MSKYVKVINQSIFMAQTSSCQFLHPHANCSLGVDLRDLECEGAMIFPSQLCWPEAQMVLGTWCDKAGWRQGLGGDRHGDGDWLSQTPQRAGKSSFLPRNISLFWLRISRQFQNLCHPPLKILDSETWTKAVTLSLFFPDKGYNFLIARHFPPSLPPF